MVFLNTCLVLQTSVGIALIPQGLKESATEIVVLFNFSSTAGRAVEQKCFMQICQSCRPRARNKSGSNNRVLLTDESCQNTWNYGVP